MSEEQFGAAAEEAAGGFTPMPDAAPAASEEPIGGDSSSLREAADSLAAGREQRVRDTPDEIEYQDRGKLDADGRPIQTDRRQTVKPERAALDLAEFRRSRDAAAEQEAVAKVAAEVDAVRAGLQPPNPQQQPSAQPSPAQLDAQSALNNAYIKPTDESVAAALRNPNAGAEIAQAQQIARQRLQGIEQQYGERVAGGQPTDDLEQQYAQVSQEAENIGYLERMQMMVNNGHSPKVAAAFAHREVLEFVQKDFQGLQAQVQNVLNAAQGEVNNYVSAVTAVMTANFPELHHVSTPEGMRIALATIRRENPARAEQIERGLAVFDHAIARKADLEKQKEVVAKQRLQQYQQEQDRAFRASHPEFLSPNIQLTVAHGVVEMLMKEGLSQQQVMHLQHNDPTFRHHVFQSLLLDAFKYRQAKSNSPQKRYNTPTRVMKPGSAAESVHDRSEKMPAAMNGAVGLRQAAQILQSRRAKR